MSCQPAVCRLLGGSGRPTLVVVPPPKVPAILAPVRGFTAAADPKAFVLPLAA